MVAIYSKSYIGSFAQGVPQSIIRKGAFSIMGKTTEPIRSKKELQDLANYFLLRGQYRNYAMIIMATCTALRISDLLRLRWDDVYNEKRGKFNSHLTLVEHKTGKQKTIALNQQILQALRLYLPHRRGEYIFSNGRRKEAPISRVQAWRIIKAAVAAIGIVGKIACHSLRKTFGYHAWVEQNISPVVIMQIYNHSSYDVTRRYLGITQDELDKAYLCMELF